MVPRGGMKAEVVTAGHAVVVRVSHTAGRRGILQDQSPSCMCPWAGRLSGPVAPEGPDRSSHHG